jgi:hypothetical protein
MCNWETPFRHKVETKIYNWETPFHHKVQSDVKKERTKTEKYKKNNIILNKVVRYFNGKLVKLQIIYDLTYTWHSVRG